MNPEFRCLIFDHDDTAVDSTATVHFPAHLEVMKRLRPGEPVIDLNTWFEKNFDPGIMTFLTEDIGLTDEEMAEEFEIWQQFNENRTPPFYEGMPELMKDFVDGGGILAVVSHSTENHIRRHYSAGAPGVEPRFVFGWDHDPSRRKPSPWPIRRILAETGLSPRDLLVVDDLKPGIDMARAAGVRTAAAGWGHEVPKIQAAMKELCDYWVPDVPALRKLVLG